MPSYLSFSSTEAFRRKCLIKNLQPYTVTGVYTPPAVTDIVTDTVQRDLAVVDSPNNLISQDPFADVLYPLNAYGPDGGYNKNINVGGLANTQSNLGPYDYRDAKLPQLSAPIELHIPTQNKYAPQNTIQLISINDIQTVPTFKQYAEPLSFVPSTYTPYQILLQSDPTGDNGPLSQDSYLAQLGAKTLKKEFQDRIGRNLIRFTLGRVNLPNAISDPVRATQLLQGKVPLIEKDWVITRPGNLVVAAVDFAARLEGVYYPGSEIPGDYFTTSEQNLSLFGQISKAFNGGKDPRGTFLGKVFGRFMSQKSPSQLFLDNTGGGQKSQLYYNLGFNRYAPDYDKSLLGEIGDIAGSAIRSLFDMPTKGGYYVGSKNLDASRVDSPAGSVPLNAFGQEVPSPVYGPSEMGKLFEGDINLEFGLNGKSITDNGDDISGGFVWTSPKYNSDLIKSQYNSTSLSGDLKQGSILDNTQRLVESADGLSGPLRYSHVGNAINQLSTIFNDGYKTISKGSQVVGFTNGKKQVFETNNIYCRVFTKERPYFTYGDLQKTDGNIRKYEYSVLDKTYNLNIAPLKGLASTNISNGKVKKYMFSLENLAWRTSNRPGLTYNDLPECERGPNGGRIMWFPPYDISFNETSSPSFTPQDFLGRPEPVYTYKSTKRSGSLSWKIIVDHPSILNVIADKELKSETNSERINQIVDSFFAGCLKFDIYELARRWNTIPTRELYALQQVITQNQPTVETITTIAGEINSTSPATVTDNPDVKTTDVQVPNLKEFVGFGYYFDNDWPDGYSTNATTTTQSWSTLYNAYIGSKSRYLSKTPGDKTPVEQFFEAIKFNYDKTEEFLKKIEEYFKAFQPSPGQTQPSVEIIIDGSPSAPATKSYNINLSKRRINSIENYIKSGFLKTYYDKGLLKIKTGNASGEGATNVNVKAPGSVNIPNVASCTDDDTNKTTYDKIYSPSAMACRRVVISDIVYTKPEPMNNTSGGVITGPSQNGGGVLTGPTSYNILKPTPPTITTTQKLKEGISKKILRHILSECDYFEVIKETDMTVYDSIKGNLKFFHPAFHSMTPEGLNSRLTFLQQCMRPGDTIPIIGTDGKPKYNNSVNTAFGAPPVLILRVGDFYHTKIIPSSLQIQYDPLIFDMNPEGIGVQPMIAKITLAFDIVGGEGLKGPIDKLQNALSFNYYANTEMYDEEADWTDDSFKKIDDELIKKLLADQPAVGANDFSNNIENGGGDTIGVIKDQQVSDAGISGTTSYKKIMDSLYDGGQTYIDMIYGKTQQIITNYNYPIYILYTSKRNYISGKTREFTTPIDVSIFGKPDNPQNLLKELSDKLKDDINKVKDSNDEGFEFIRDLYSTRFDSTIINKIKFNLTNEVDLAYNDISTALSQITTNIVENEQNLIRIMRKLDFVDSQYDGYIKPDQGTEIYNISSTTFSDFVNDYTSASTKLNSFYTLLKDSQLIDVEYSPDNIKIKEDGIFDYPACNGCSIAEKRFYMLMSKRVLTDFENFKKSVLGDVGNIPVNGITPELIFKENFNDRRNIDYKKEHDREVNDFKTFTDSYNSNFKNWNPFVKKEIDAEFSNYSSGNTQTQSKILQNIYMIGNSNSDNKTFNGKNKLL